MRSFLATLMALTTSLFLSFGCGSDQDPPTGSTAANGGAGAKTGGGPPAQAAVALDRTNVEGCLNIATGSVSEPPEPQDYAAIVDPNIPPPDDVRVIDGENGTVVSCRVSGVEPITVSGNVRTARMVFVVDGTVSGGSGTATISEWDVITQETLSGECALTVKSLSPGAVWSQFVCEDFVSPPAIRCRAEGAFVFENCRE